MMPEDLRRALEEYVAALKEQVLKDPKFWEWLSTRGSRP